MSTKLLSGLAALLLVASCQPNPQDLEGKQKLLDKKEKELSELKEEISQLKEEIAALDTVSKTSKLTPVKVAALSEQRFDHFVLLTGTATSRQNILLSAEANGRIEQIRVTEGDQVKKGELLVEIDNNTIRQQLEEARATLELARTTYQKRQRLWDQSIGSEIEYLTAKNNYETARSRVAQLRSNLAKTRIKSPIDGIVDRVAANEGEFVNFGAPVVRVVDIEEIEIDAELSERYLTSIKEGDSVEVQIPTLNLKKKAEVSFVGQTINPANRSFSIKVKLPNPGSLIKPNSLANLRIRDYRNDTAMVVPAAVIGKDLQGDFVYVTTEGEDGQLRAEKRYVTKGYSFGESTEIISGLKPGDQVITLGYDQVNSGEPVQLQG